MNDLEIIGKWVRNPSRSFKDGLAIREKYKINNDKDDFYNRANPDKPNSVVSNMLMQDVSKILIKLRNNPKLLEAKAEQMIAQRKPIVATPLPPRAGRVKIESDTVKEQDLPDNLKPVFARIKKIAPLLGGKHAKMKAAKSDAEAKALVNEIATLDAEKRACWAQIDKFFKTKNVNLVIKPEVVAEEVEKTPLDKIMEITDPKLKLESIKKREKVVVDDIAKAKDKLEEFKKSKPHMVKEKEKSIAKKEQELKSLQDARAAIKGDK